ncbi:MAG: rod-binding protein [Selenomonadaceae bacterium]
MQVDAIGSLGTVNNTYADAQQSINTAKFSDELKKVQKQAAAVNAVTGKTDAAVAAKDKKLNDACEGFEDMFLELMYSKMRDTVPEDKLFGDSNGDKIMQSMLDSEMMKKVASSGGIGIAKMIREQLKK